MSLMFGVFPLFSNISFTLLHSLLIYSSLYKSSFALHTDERYNQNEASRNSTVKEEKRHLVVSTISNFNSKVFTQYTLHFSLEPLHNEATHALPRNPLQKSI